MVMTSPALAIRAQRELTVQAHIEAENRHDVEATLHTFHHAQYDVIPFGQVTDGEQAVRELLGSLIAAFPDFHVEAHALYHADNAVVCEVVMTGTQKRPWMGIDPQGGRMRVPAACIYVFEEDRLVCEKVYFDTATMIRQLTGG
jgi:steroid delta-isomerase-like uncharacterized protein